MRNRLLIFPILWFCAALLNGVCAAEEQAEVAWPSNERLDLENGDALEFVLKLPKTIWASAPEAALPNVTVFFDALPAAGRVLVAPSVHAGEWIVQARDLRIPEAQTSALRVAWSFAKAGGVAANSEIQFQGKLRLGHTPIDVVLLIDGSGSMAQSDPKSRRVDATRAFLETARQSSAIGRIGIVQFDFKAETLIGMTPVTGNFDSALTRIHADGGTDIDLAIKHCLNLLGAQPDGAAIILFTDGQQDPGVYSNSHREAVKAGVTIHTMALGKDADRKVLKLISSETGGSFADAESDNDISAAYSAIVRRLTRLHVLQSGSINEEREARAPVDPSCRAVQVDVVADGKGVLELELPKMAPWSSGETAGIQHFIEQPPPGALDLKWTAKEALGLNPRYTVTSHTTLFPLWLRTNSQPSAPLELDVNDPRLSISLFDGATPIAGMQVRGIVDFVGADGQMHRRDVELDNGHSADGIYGADARALEFLMGPGIQPDGHVALTVTGTHQGYPFRREIEAAFQLERLAPPALVVNGALNFGTHYPGEHTQAEIYLRVRGLGGSLKSSIDPVEFTNAFKINFPAQLRPAQRLTQNGEFIFPEAPGEYSGHLHLALENVEAIDVPWSATVAAISVQSNPAQIDFGTVFPGEKRSTTIHLNTGGGTLETAPLNLSPFRIQPAEKFTLDKTGHDVKFEFAAAANAPASEIKTDLIVRDLSGKERLTIPISATVPEVKLQIEAPLNLGALEPGDSIERTISMKWSGGKNVPIRPAITLGKSLFMPALGTLTARDGGFSDSFIVRIPATQPSGDLSGTVNVDAGPFHAALPWSSTVIPPSFQVSMKTLDFGRMYPGKRVSRSLVLSATGTRPIEIDASLSQPLRKPKLTSVELAGALNFPAKTVLTPGKSSGTDFTLTIPDDAQDGVYAATITLSARTGTLDIPLNVKVVNVVDAAAFHLEPSSFSFIINEGEKLPVKTLTLVSHDDEVLNLSLKIPLPPPQAEEADAKSPSDKKIPTTIAYFFKEESQKDIVTELNVELPPRGKVSLFLRPHANAQHGATGTVIVDGGGEHQQAEINVERYGSSAALPAPQAPSLLNWIIAGFILLLIAIAVLIRLLVKQGGARYVGYAIVIHLAIFSMAVPPKTIMEALPESIEITLLDTQQSLGMQMSDDQSRRLEALRAGPGGAGDADKKTAALPQTPLALPAPQTSSKDLPAPGIGQLSPITGPLNLEAARGVEKPVRLESVPEPARGAPQAPVATDAPLALDDDKTLPPIKVQPAPAATMIAATPRTATALTQETATPPKINETDFVVPEQARVVVPSNAVPLPQRIVTTPQASEKFDAPLSIDTPVRRTPTTAVTAASTLMPADAPLALGNDAPLAFDDQPAQAPHVRANPQPVTNPERNVPVAAFSTGKGSSGLGILDAPLTPLEMSAPGIPGNAGGDKSPAFVALARTSPVPNLDVLAGMDGGSGGIRSDGFTSTASDKSSGLGFSRTPGGLPGGGDEPLPIGDGPIGAGIGGKLSGGGSDQGGGGKGSGDGSSITGALHTGGDGSSPGRGGGGDAGGTRAYAAGGGLGLGGNDPFSGGTGSGKFAIGLANGNGSEWHGRPGGNGKGIALLAGPSSAALEGGGGRNGAGGGSTGNGSGTGTGNGDGGKNNSAAGSGGNGGAPDGLGFGPGGRRIGGWGLKEAGPGGPGDAPLAVGPVGGGGLTPTGTGVASGGGDISGHGGGGGNGVGRTGAAGGTALDGFNGPGGTGFGQFNGVAARGATLPPSGSGTRTDLPAGPGSENFDDPARGFRSAFANGVAAPGHRGINSVQTGGLVRVGIGVAKHNADWDSSPMALPNLRAAFIERSGLPELEVTLSKVDLSDLSALMRCHTIMLTSNFPVNFKPAEATAIREYIKRGGTLWINDSSASDYEKFDEALRPQIPLLIPGGELEKLPLEHDFFVACYDLRNGFKGYRIPPGDKYRQDYLEAVFIPEQPPVIPAANAKAEVVDVAEWTKHRRAGIIYTRNDYSDGLQIDPLLNTGMKSLTDFTQGEMLESSTRWGMNLVAYTLGSQGVKLPPPPETTAEFEKLYRYSGPPLTVLDDFTVLLDKWKKPTWIAEKEWCNDTTLSFAQNAAEKGNIATVVCTGGTKFKAGITRFGDLDLAGARAVVMDLNSGLPQGLSVALLFAAKGGKAYESRAVFVRPGWNRNLRFPLDLGDMKSSASKEPWKNYDTPFEPRNAIERISILIYNLNESGKVLVGPLRIQK